MFGGTITQDNNWTTTPNHGRTNPTLLGIIVSLSTLLVCGAWKLALTLLGACVKAAVKVTVKAEVKVTVNAASRNLPSCSEAFALLQI